MAQSEVRAIIRLAGGDESLDIFIGTGAQVSGVDATLSRSSNKFATPSARELTSSSRMNNDMVNIDGVIYCLLCDGSQLDISDYLPSFKRHMAEYQYRTDMFAELITDYGIFKNMGLLRVNFSTDGDYGQRTIISTNWEQVNVAGSVDANSVDIGGLTV